MMETRKINRLAEYDYSTVGAYFITICTKDKHKIFWNNNVGDGSPVPKLTENNGTGNPSPTTTGNVMGWFKYNATKAINEKIGTIGKSIFQRSYYDHIIRNQHDYDAAWQYIDENPVKWETDEFYN